MLEISHYQYVKGTQHEINSVKSSELKMYQLWEFLDINIMSRNWYISSSEDFNQLFLAGEACSMRSFVC
jgi:hypothetical protein